MRVLRVFPSSASPPLTEVIPARPRSEHASSSFVIGRACAEHWIRGGRRRALDVLFHRPEEE